MIEREAQTRLVREYYVAVFDRWAIFIEFVPINIAAGIGIAFDERRVRDARHQMHGDVGLRANFWKAHQRHIKLRFLINSTVKRTIDFRV